MIKRFSEHLSSSVFHVLWKRMINQDLSGLRNGAVKAEMWQTCRRVCGLSRGAHLLRSTVSSERDDVLAVSDTGLRKPLQACHCVRAPRAGQDTPVLGSALPVALLCQCSRQVTSTASVKWGGGSVLDPGTRAVTGGQGAAASSVPRTADPAESDSGRTALGAGAGAFLFIVPSRAPPLGTSHGQVRPN